MKLNDLNQVMNLFRNLQEIPTLYKCSLINSDENKIGVASMVSNIRHHKEDFQPHEETFFAQIGRLILKDKNDLFINNKINPENQIKNFDILISDENDKLVAKLKNCNIIEFFYSYQFDNLNLIIEASTIRFDTVYKF